VFVTSFKSLTEHYTSGT